MLTGSVPISYRFRDKRECQSKMHLTPASKLQVGARGNSGISYGTRHITQAHTRVSTRCRPRSKICQTFAIFHFFRTVIQRHASLAELFKRPQLQPKPSSDKLYVCVEVSLRTKSLRLNFYHWCKTPSSAFSKQISATTPIFLHGFGRAPSDFENSRTICEIFHFLSIQ